MNTRPCGGWHEKGFNVAEEKEIVEEEVVEEEQHDETEDVVETPEDNGEEADEEITVSFGDEEQTEEHHEEAPEWVKNLRKQTREQSKKIKEYEKRIEELTKPVEEDIQLGEPPTLEDSDYDEDIHREKMISWFEQKQKYDAKKSEKEQAEKKQTEEWNQKLSGYEEAKAKMKVKDYDDAEFVVTSTLSETQQGIIVDGVDDPALIVYALGKNPKKTEELAKITNPVRFAIALGKLEKDLKVGKRKPPEPEKKLESNSAFVGNDKRLEALEAEARKTGNRTKVIAYKKKMKG